MTFRCYAGLEFLRFFIRGLELDVERSPTVLVPWESVNRLLTVMNREFEEMRTTHVTTILIETTDTLVSLSSGQWDAVFP